MSAALVLRKDTEWSGWRTAQDIVFRNRNSGSVFSLGFIKASASVALTELRLPNENGILGGTGFFRIEGSVTIAQNGLFVMSQLLRGLGHPDNFPSDSLWEMFVLWRDGTAMAVTPQVGTEHWTNAFRDYLLRRYPLLADWDNARGVRLGLTTTLGGSNLVHQFDISGFTFVTIQYEPDDFYADFLDLER